MGNALLRLYVWQVNFMAPRGRGDERGEGVISAAIAVLIMAFLGVVVWVGFRATLDNTQKKVDKQVDQIGE
jgi:type VI protein secretion system component VasF